MKKGRKLISIGIVLFIIFCIHVSSAWAEGSSPSTVVKDFARDYFMLNSSMAAYLSKDARINENEIDMVDFFLETKASDARNKGYKISYLQMLPVNMKTKVLSMDESSATVQFNAITLRSINPLYRITGFIFGLLDEHEVQDVISVVKEDGEWKIGPGAFDFPVPI